MPAAPPTDPDVRDSRIRLVAVAVAGLRIDAFATLVPTALEQLLDFLFQDLLDEPLDLAAYKAFQGFPAGP